jgi:hypothetical protein
MPSFVYIRGTYISIHTFTDYLYIKKWNNRKVYIASSAIFFVCRTDQSAKLPVFLRIFSSAVPPTVHSSIFLYAKYMTLF